MNWSKFEEQRREYIGFKEDFGPKIQVVWCDRGSGLMATITQRSWSIVWSGSGSPFFCWMGHDRATIERRSSHDRASIVVLRRCRSTVRWRSSDDNLDPPSDEDPLMMISTILRSWWIQCRSSDEDQMMTMCPRGAPRFRNHERLRPSDEAMSDEAMIKSWRRSDAPGTSTCHQVSPRSHPLIPPIEHVLMMEIRWTPHPSHQRISIKTRASDVHRAATYLAKVRTVWEHSPTWKKNRKRSRLNIGAV